MFTNILYSPSLYTLVDYSEINRFKVVNMANCVFNGCYTNRNTKIYNDVGLFKLPGRTDTFYAEWKEKVVHVITRYRVEDDALACRIKNGNVWC